MRQREARFGSGHRLAVLGVLLLTTNLLSCPDITEAPPFSGRSPSVPNSRGMLTFENDTLTAHELRWQSEDLILGELDTGMFPPQTWQTQGANPRRLTFIAALGSIQLEGEVLFAPYNRGVVDVVEGAKRVRYLLKIAPEITELRPDFAKNFLRDDAAHPVLAPLPTPDRYHAFIDWKGNAPGSARFDIEEVAASERDGTAANPSATTPAYDLENDLTLIGDNEIGAVANSPEGPFSPRIAIEQGMAEVPRWLSIALEADGATLDIKPRPQPQYEREILYEGAVEWPDEPFSTPKIGGKIPNNIPILGGIELPLSFKLNDSQVTGDVSVSSRGPGAFAAKGTTSIDLELPTFELTIGSFPKVAGQLDLHSGALEIEQLKLTDQNELKISKSLTVRKIPGARGLLRKIVSKVKNIPKIGNLLRRAVLKLAKQKLAVGGSQKKTTDLVLVESNPGLLNSRLGFDSGTITHDSRATGTLKLDLSKNVAEGSLDLEVGTLGSFTAQNPGSSSFLDAFGFDLAADFASRISLTIKGIKACTSGGGVGITASRPAAGTFTSSARILDEVTSIDCDLSKFFRKAWDGARNRVQRKLASFWPFSTLPTEEVELLEDTVPEIGASFDIRGADRGMIVFNEFDLIGTTDVGTEIFGMFWDGSDFVGPTRITTDALQDAAPKVRMSPSGDAVAVWEKIGTPLNDSVDLDDALMGSFEIYYATFDIGTETWSSPQALTSNAVVDHTPLLERYQSGAIVAWLTNPDNLLVGDATNPDSVLFSVWNGIGFSAPATAVSATNVQDLDLAGDGSTAMLVWIRDNAFVDLEDEDLLVTDEFDQEVLVSTYDGLAWSTPLELTDDLQSDLLPRAAVDASGDATIVWVQETVTLEQVDRGGEIFDVPNVTQALLARDLVGGVWGPTTLLLDDVAIADMDVRFDADDNLVVIWEETADSGLRALRYASRDAVTGAVTPPRTLTRTDYIHGLREMAFLGGRVYALYTRSVADEVTLQLEDETGTPTDVTLDEPGDTSLSILVHHVFVDAAVVDEDVSFSPPNPAPGTSATILIDVTNTGDREVSSVEVVADDEVGPVGSETIAMLAPGETATVSHAWTVPPGDAPHAVTVAVDPEDTIAEWFEDNNDAARSTSLPNLRVTDAFTFSTDAAPNIVELRATVLNEGVTTASAITVEVALDDVLTSIGSTVILGLAPGTDTEVSVSFPDNVGAPGLHDLIVTADPADAIEESDEEDNARVFPINLGL